MAIALPAFENPLCQTVGVCAQLKDSEVLRRLPSDDIEMIARYGPSSARMLAHLVWNPRSKHLHTDIALPSAFGKDVPRTNERVSTFRKMLAQFEGLSATASAHGSFVIPLASLPPAGGLIFIAKNRSSSGAEIELTSATLTFRRADIRRIRWSLVGEKVWLDITAAKTDFPIDAGYLAKAISICSSATDSYILRKKTDG